MSEKTRLKKGEGVVSYLQYRQFIVDMLKRGHTIRAVHTALKVEVEKAEQQMISYRQLTKLTHSFDQAAFDYLRQLKNPVTVPVPVESGQYAEKEIDRLPVETTPAIAPTSDSGKNPKKSDALKPQKFTYNPHFKPEDL